MNPEEILFVGLGTTVPMYYRCLLPARAIGCDYVGVHSEPPGLIYATGIVQGQSKMPDFSDYKLVIIQQPCGEGWLKAIKQLQERGITVLAELDDHLHGIKDLADHDFRQHFGAQKLADFESCFRQVDGLIVSTPWLGRAYRGFNKRSWVCRNGIDPARYQYTLPPRETVTYGWAGATGHRDAATPWLQAAAEAMAERPQTCFASIGQPFAEGFKVHFGEQRAISVPFCAIEQYPAAMTLFDIALGPAGKSNFYKAKSNLRLLEAGALGIPLIGHTAVYGGIQDGVDGFKAINPRRVKELLLRLTDDPELRRQIGANAKARVLSDWTVQQTATDWEAPIKFAQDRALKVVH